MKNLFSYFYEVVNKIERFINRHYYLFLSLLRGLKKMCLSDKIKRNLRQAVVPALISGAVLFSGCGRDRDEKLGIDYGNPMSIPERPTQYEQKLQSEDGKIDLYLGVNGDDILFAEDYMGNTFVFIDRNKDGKTAEQYWRLKGKFGKRGPKSVESFFSVPGPNADIAYERLRATAFLGLRNELREVVEDLDP